MNKFDSYLNNLKHEFPIIALSETWLTENNCDRFGIDGYNAEHNFRSNRGGGGVAIYIEVFIQYTTRYTDIKQFNDYVIQCLTQIKAEKNAYLLGDYNINLLNIDKHAASQDFADAMFSILSFLLSQNQPE